MDSRHGSASASQWSMDFFGDRSRCDVIYAPTEGTLNAESTSVWHRITARSITEGSTMIARPT